jgi:indolepyruvate ferredoxin oxidoreductase
MGKVLVQLTPKNHAIACQLAALPQTIRGFGHVKERNLKAAKVLEEKLWEKMGRA